MTKIIGVISARVNSRRCPGKVLRKFAGKSMFSHHVERMRKIDGLDGVYLATTSGDENKELLTEARSLGCDWYLGTDQDLVNSHIQLCEMSGADAVIRVPGDSPLFDIDSCTIFVKKFRQEYWDYLYVLNMTMLQGTVKELISYEALKKIHPLYKGPAVSLPIMENMSAYKTWGHEIDVNLCRPEYRLTVDYPIDYNLLCHIYDQLYKGEPLNLHEVYKWLDDNPKMAFCNKDVVVSGVNKHIGSLMDRNLYSIMERAGKPVLLDERKQIISQDNIKQIIINLFPDIKW